MKKLLIPLLIICNPVSAQTVTIRADEWFPINGTPGSNLPGYMIELAEKTFDHVDYKLMPWSRAVEVVRKGEFDCVVGAYIDDVPDFIMPTENWSMDQTGVFVRSNDSWTYEGVDSLLSRKVGVIRGYDYEEAIDPLIISRKDVFKLIGGNDALTKNIRKLEAGRINTMIESAPVMSAKILELGISHKFKQVGSTSEPQALFIACSPNNPRSKELVKQVDITTRQLRESGELEQIMNKYGLTDWK